MDDFPIFLALDDRDLAADFAHVLAKKMVTFVVRHHEGLMEWQFRFTADDFTAIGDALNEALAGQYV